MPTTRCKPQITYQLRRPHNQPGNRKHFRPLWQSDVAATLPPAGVQGSISLAGLVPGYEILGELGRGGMGVVYKARQIGLGRLVALKMILAGGHASSADMERFRTEAESIARLQHPNIVQIHEGHWDNASPSVRLRLP
jgi:serine/threonine protein kinase